MAATTNLEKAPPTDTTVLGRNYLLAPTEAIQAAVLNLQFELDQRAERDAVHQRLADVSAQRVAEIDQALALANGVETP